MAKNDQTLHKSIQHALKAPNFFTSKVFLKNVMNKVKIGSTQTAPSLKGHVLVLGIGDTALDCARSAFRQGAERVTVAFRRGFQDIRANDEIFEPARHEGINFLPYSAPLEYVLDKSGKIMHVEFDKNLTQNTYPAHLKYNKTNQKFQMPVDTAIQSFRCVLPDQDWVKKIKKADNLVDAYYSTGQTKA